MKIWQNVLKGIFLFILVIAISICSLSIGSSANLAPKRYAIMGILQRADGTPAFGEKVYLAYGTKQGVFARMGMVDEKIQIVSPGGKVGKTGRFRIEFDEEFLKDALDTLKTKRFSLIIAVGSKTFPICEHNIDVPGDCIGIFIDLPDILGNDIERDLGTFKMPN